MKICLLLDKTIHKNLLGQVQLQLEQVYQGLDIKWVIQERDYTSYPIEEYFNGYYGMNHNWLRSHCADVYKKYSEEIDVVVFMVASDNWVLDDPAVVGENRVWGWNISNQYSGYGVQQVRFAQRKDHTDARNVNNSAGTLYHELMHDHDTYVFVNTGEIIERLTGVQSHDNDLVHGGSPLWSYIRTTNDNVRAVELILPSLIKARNTRKVVYLKKKIGLLQKIQQLMMQVRALQAAVREDIALLPNNQCIHDK
jgi:hypothetical protein